MAGKKPVGHASTYPYPTLEQTIPELSVAKDFVFALVGGNVPEDKSHGVKAIHTCASFALSLALPHREPVGGAADTVPESVLNDLVGLANAAQPAGVAFQAGPVGAFPWLAVAMAILELLKKLSG